MKTIKILVLRGKVMERLTKQWGNNPVVPCRLNIDFVFDMNNEDYTAFQDILDRLAYYEDLEEQGWMVKLPCEFIYYIVDQGSKFAMVMAKNIYDLPLYEIKAIDRSGRYFSTKEAAEKELRYSK